ncbi:hypothetical protein [Niabella hibiscisoli]|uniref:hypothetical protein n=1 Tax=Niabella hibiscisoli TaxID=1825928 RepID=UPI001F0D8A48|nr:hypothetical protein [Niabella hibiscisoli]MCH5716251.1 hypothetical protein [Niabella hibiscisoli]
MSLVKSIKRLEYANFLIRKKATGDLKTFAKKMKLSERAVKILVSEMREMGASIQYDRSRKSYYYLEEGEFCISKFIKYGEILSSNEAAKVGKPEELCFSEKAIFILCKDT